MNLLFEHLLSFRDRGIESTTLVVHFRKDFTFLHVVPYHETEYGIFYG